MNVYDRGVPVSIRWLALLLLCAAAPGCGDEEKTETCTTSVSACMTDAAPTNTGLQGDHDDER